MTTTEEELWNKNESLEAANALMRAEISQLMDAQGLRKDECQVHQSEYSIHRYCALWPSPVPHADHAHYFR